MTNDKKIEKAWEIFFPYSLMKNKQFISGEFKFVQYTSTQAAMNFIKKAEVWLRNSNGMNDYLEIEHGCDCLRAAFHSESTGKCFKELLSKIHPDLENKLVKYFDGWISKFRFDTYLISISEHPPKEDQFGRLSMWRAYGGRQAVAIVINSQALIREPENNIFEAELMPVIYQDESGFEKDLKELTGRIEKNLDFIKTLGKDNIFEYLFEVFRQVVFTVKHPGFSEEREWRVIYNPSYKKSKYVLEEVVCINGVPQRIYKIPIKNVPEESFTGFEIHDLVDKIIIGPSDNQIILGDAFSSLLRNAGCEAPEKRIRYSGIPLR